MITTITRGDEPKMSSRSLPDFRDNPTNVKKSALVDQDIDTSQIRPVVLMLLDATAKRLKKVGAHSAFSILAAVGASSWEACAN